MKFHLAEQQTFLAVRVEGYDAYAEVGLNVNLAASRSFDDSPDDHVTLSLRAVQNLQFDTWLAGLRSIPRKPFFHLRSEPANPATAERVFLGEVTYVHPTVERRSVVSDNFDDFTRR
jgi:hypothetical protein